MSAGQTHQNQHGSALSLGDRIIGCLIGGACGDALGAPVEFLTLPPIRARYGPERITNFDEAYGVVSAITDDTQMSAFTTEGLIRASIRQALRGICHPPSVVHHAYARWLATQDQPYRPGSFGKELDGWLVEEKRLWSQRAPGNTCLSALRATQTFGSFAENDSKGCGTVMRSAPFGFLARRPEDMPYMFDIAVESARTTHGHPSGFLAAGALAWIISLIVQGSELGDAAQQSIRKLEDHRGSEEVRSALQRALQVAQEPRWRDLLPQLGQGWVAEEALAIAVLCALAAESPREAIIAAVNHDGDSDSTGSITGNIVGTMHGVAALPEEWVEQVELRDVIETLAEDFTKVLEGRADPEEL